MDVRYRGPHDSTHELMGTFVPETTVLTNDGARSMFSLLRDGRWLAIETRPTFDARVDRLGAIRIAVDRLDGIPDARAILVRPDGHIAWAGDVSDASLESTLLRWSGEAPSKSGSLFG